MAEKRQCPECFDEFVVQKNGRLRAHGPVDQRCEQDPANAVHIQICDGPGCGKSYELREQDEFPKHGPRPGAICPDPQHTMADPLPAPVVEIRIPAEPGPMPTPNDWYEWIGVSFQCSRCEGRILEGDRVRHDGNGAMWCEDCGLFDEGMDKHVRESLGVAKDLYPDHDVSAVPGGGAVAIPPGLAFEDPFDSPTEVEETDELNVSGQPKARYEWRGSQNLGYLVRDPETGDFRRYKNGNPKGLTRATTFNKAASSTTSLTEWKQRNVVIGASRRPDLMIRAHGLTHETGRRELNALVAEFEETAGAKVGADIGTYLHAFTELMDAGLKTADDAPPEYEKQLRLYERRLRDAGLEPVPGLIERTTAIREFGGVVGTFDRIFYDRPHDRYVIGDLKTGKTMDYARDETYCQEWIYAHGVNQSGVYDWNTDTWSPVGDPMTRGPHPDGVPIKVSETVGVIIHMPVQGDDAGSVFLEEADLVKGARYAQLCHDVRSNVKPKRKLWVSAPVAAAVAVPAGLNDETDLAVWGQMFGAVRSQGEAYALYERAKAAGVPGLALSGLVQIATDALTRVDSSS